MKKLIAKIYLLIISIAIISAVVYFGKIEAVYFIITLCLIITLIWALLEVYDSDKKDGVN